MEKYLRLFLIINITLLGGTKLCLILLEENVQKHKVVQNFQNKDLISRVQIIAPPVIDEERPDMRFCLGSQNGSNCGEVFAKFTNSLKN